MYLEDIYTVLANLVMIFNVCPMTEPKGIQQLLSSLMTKSTEFPEVSGLYKLFTKTLCQCDALNLLTNGSALVKVSTLFLLETLDKSATFENELLFSVLKMVINLPLHFISSLLPALALPMAKVRRSLNSLTT